MRWGLLIVILLTAFFTLLPEPEAAAQLPSQNFVIRNVRLFDGDKIHPSTDLLIEGGVIKLIKEKINNRRNFSEIDGDGKTLMPGLVDAHAHVWGDALTQAINAGVTTELDMFSMPQLISPMQQQRDDNKNTAQADVFSATILATAPNGHGTEYGFDIPVLTGPTQAKDFVEQRIKQGADYIKIVYDAPDSPYQFSPSISLETLTELVKQAHIHNKLAVVHIDNLKSAKQAVRAGVDGLIHSFMDAVADDELAQLMQQNHVFFIPTLTVEASLAQVMPDQSLLGDLVLVDYINAEQMASLKAPFMNLGFKPSDLSKAKQSVKKLHRAGITILAGTDAPNPGTAHGISLHEELRLLVEAGLTPLQALKAATSNSHNAFNIGYRGTIAINQPATMVLVDGDPTLDIMRTRHITAIWKNGQWFERVVTKPDNSVTPAISAGLIADFNQQTISTFWGEGIEATNDNVIGGHSTVSVLLNQSEGILNVSGEVKKGFTYPWAGVQFFTTKKPGQAMDLSQLQTLEFRAKGNISTLYVMLFQKGSYQPVVQSITLSKDWQTHSVKLSGFTNADLANVTALTWVASQTLQTFEFAIDDIALR